MNLFLGITVLAFLLIIIKPIRRYHFDYFPNFHFIGVVLLFILTIARIAHAKNEGKDPLWNLQGNGSTKRYARRL